MSNTIKYSVKRATDPSNPLRLVERGMFEGRTIEVVTGYDVSQDRYPVHIYVVDADGTRNKLQLGSVYESDEGAAFSRGWREVDGHFRH